MQWISCTCGTVADAEQDAAVAPGASGNVPGPPPDGAAGNEGGEISVTIDETSIWRLTADSHVTALDGKTQIDLNGYTLYVNGEAVE